MRATDVFSLIIFLITFLELGEVIAQVETSENQDLVYISSTTSSPPKAKPKIKSSVTGKSIDCPPDCSCTDKKVTCEGKKLKTTPNLSKSSTVTTIYLSKNSIEVLDLNLLPTANLEQLYLDHNVIKNFSYNSKSSFNKLKILNLTDNQLESLTPLAYIKFPSLETLDLSFNPVKELGETSFSNATGIQVLNLAGLKLEKIHESTFAPLVQLKSLNISDNNLSHQTNQLSPRQFANNKKLEIVDLSNTFSLEVPVALRSTTSIKTLFLNQNLMTSLRPSDFLQQESLVYLEIKYCPKLIKVDEQAFFFLRDLKTLKLSNNLRLQYISKDAFESSNEHNLDLFDISKNNISKLSDPQHFPSFSFKQIILSENPWDCDCDLSWMQTLPISSRSPVHCKTPEQFKDLEISAFLSTRDCEAESTSYHNIIVTAFLIFLFGLLIAIIIQRTDFCYRQPPRDQHSSVYYTKNKFSESVQEV